MQVNIEGVVDHLDSEFVVQAEFLTREKPLQLRLKPLWFPQFTFPNDCDFPT